MDISFGLTMMAIFAMCMRSKKGVRQMKPRPSNIWTKLLARNLQHTRRRTHELVGLKFTRLSP
eukprot:2401971-Karenia_brevis.AAC.1